MNNMRGNEAYGSGISPYARNALAYFGPPQHRWYF